MSGFKTVDQRYAAMAVPWHPTHPMPSNVKLSYLDRQQIVGVYPLLNASRFSKPVLIGKYGQTVLFLGTFDESDLVEIFQ